MPDNIEKDNSVRKQFINEKVAKKPRKQIVYKIVRLLGSAVIFGLVAIITAVFSRPYAEHFLNRETVQTQESIVIPKDVPETPEPASETSEAETEPVEEIVQSAIEKYEYSANDLNTMFSGLSNLCNELDKSVVAVHSVKNEKDWFDNPLEMSGMYSGIIIASTETETIILTTLDAAGDADAIRVTFNDSSELSAQLKRTDKLSGLAVISVKNEEMDERILNSLKAVELGNSYQVKRGDIIMLIGSPLGMVHSSSYGTVSYVVKSAAVTDGTARVIYTDADSDADAGSWLINTQGQLIGWVSRDFGQGRQNSGTAYGISDFKGILERMTNAKASAYLGLNLAEINSEMKEKGITHGLYVSKASPEGPAYEAGIQTGDIITKIGEREMHDINAYKALLEELHAEDTVHIDILRNGREEYTELEFTLTAGAR